MKILSRFPASEVLSLYPGCCIWRNPGHVDCTCKDQLYTTCNTGLPENITFIARVTMTWRTCWQSVGETHHTCTRPCTVRHVHKISDLQHYTEYTHIAYPGKIPNKIKQVFLYNGYTEIPGFMGQIHYSWNASLYLSDVVYPILLQ